MSLTIPASTAYTLKEGARGIPAFSAQRVCNKMGYPVAEDMDFGPKTKAAVQKLQTRLGLTADGVLGPQTQGRLARHLCDRQEQVNDLPAALLYSKISYESGGFLTAVNWSVAGGVDCGMTQRRVYNEQFSDDAVVKRAFDAVYQVDLSGDRARELYEIFRARPGINHNVELAWRVSVLNHNYPTLADKISRVGIAGLSSYYTTRQSWVANFGLRFPDGTAILTPLQWGRRYSLGSAVNNEPGQAVKMVRTWSA